MLGRLILPTLVFAALLAGCASKGAETPASDDADATPRAAPTPSPSPAALPAPTFTPPAAEPAPAALPSPEVALPAGPLEVTVPIVEAAFPPVLALPLGSTVTWSNQDDETHSVLSSDGAFSGTAFLGPGMEFHRTFLATGEYAFQCRYHDGMTGLLIVR